MNRELILRQLHAHSPADEHEELMRHGIIEFVRDHDLFHSRALTIGHVTASAWIVDDDRSHALLLHHGRLDRWLQPGGHIEEDADLAAAAWREAREETGLENLRLQTDAIFDVDIHAIPERPGEPRHFHYDVRFAFVADRGEPLRISSESKSLAWVPLLTITDLTREESVLRMVRRTINDNWDK